MIIKSDSSAALTDSHSHKPAAPGRGAPAGPSNNLRMTLDAVAGATAGCIARFVVGPLDVIKIRFQVQLEPIASSVTGLKATPKYTGLRQAAITIFKEEGIQGLWRGTVPGLLLTVPYTAVQFVVLQQYKRAAAERGFSGHPVFGPWSSFVGGAIAGVSGTMASYPFDLLRTTLAAQGNPPVYRGIVDAARGIVRERGLRGLFAGLNVTLVEILPYSAIQFGTYDALNGVWSKAAEKRRRRQGVTEPRDMRLQHFSCGLLSGLVSKLTTHPLDVAKKRYQVAGLQRHLSYGARIENKFLLQALSRSLVDIYAKEGIRGLWKGCLPNIMKAAPSAAITFMAYEAVLSWLLIANAAEKRVA